MTKKRYWLGMLVMTLVFGLTVVGCVSVGVTGPLAPNVSQFVITVKRADSGTKARNQMEMYLDGRKSGDTIENGGQRQILVGNGIHTLYVKVGKYQSQMLTFEGNSEVIEFYANFEGRRSHIQLNLVKTFGGK
jgi:hypothetical protein